MRKACSVRHVHNLKMSGKNVPLVSCSQAIQMVYLLYKRNLRDINTVKPAHDICPFPSPTPPKIPDTHNTLNKRNMANSYPDPTACAKTFAARLLSILALSACGNS